MSRCFRSLKEMPASRFGALSCLPTVTLTFHAPLVGMYRFMHKWFDTVDELPGYDDLPARAKAYLEQWWQTAERAIQDELDHVDMPTWLSQDEEGEEDGGEHKETGTVEKGKGKGPRQGEGTSEEHESRTGEEKGGKHKRASKGERFASRPPALADASATPQTSMSSNVP